MINPVIIMKYYISYEKGPSPVHNHNHYEISICTKGQGICDFTDNQITITPGKILITPPHIMHKTICEKEYERIRICGDFSRFFNLDFPLAITDTPKNEGLQLAQIIYENRHSFPEYISSLCSAFAHFALKSLDTENQINANIREIMNKISEGFSDANTDVCNILKSSGYSEDYIRNQFKKTTGKTPTEFLTEIRITHACYLIDTYKNTLSLSEIAEKCGYTDYVYFSRRFKQFTGMSPKKYSGIQSDEC